MISDEILALIKRHHTKGMSALQLRKNIEALEQENILPLPKEDPRYPKSLLDLKDPPPLLFVRGKLPDLSHAVTIVGTRTASNYGKEQSHYIAKELARHGLPILSGLARGIDTAAHRGALTTGITLAVIGSGHSCLYPKENSKLAEEIANKGALISEYLPYTAPTRYTFVKRNRLLAALGRGSLLIESPCKGGSMITMEVAQTLSRKLFALPGSVDCPSFKGNFSLLKKNIASLIENAEDILSCFQLSPLKKDKTLSFDLNEEEQVVYNALNGQEKSLEELVLLTQYPIMKLNILLTSLTLKGAVVEFSGKLYKKTKI